MSERVITARIRECDRCGHECAQAQDGGLPEDWNAWREIRVPVSFGDALLLCPTCVDEFGRFLVGAKDGHLCDCGTAPAGADHDCPSAAEPDMASDDMHPIEPEERR